jgi:hypothetical protein
MLHGRYFATQSNGPQQLSSVQLSSAGLPRPGDRDSCRQGIAWAPGSRDSGAGNKEVSVASVGKQVLVAALVVVGLLVVGAVVLGTVGYVRYYEPLVRPLTFVGGAGRLESGVRNTARFEPPASGAMTSVQWADYCAVSGAVAGTLRSAVRTVETQRQVLVAQAEKQGGRVPYREALAAFREIGSVYLKAKQAQVEGLNRAGLSLAEYRWIQVRVFAAASLPLAVLDLEGMRTAPQEQRGVVDVQASPAPPVSEAVRNLVRARQASELESWRALAFFGL